MRMKMPRTKVGLSLAVAAAGLLVSSQITWAAPILPGGVQFPAVAEPGPVGATLLATTGPAPFSSPTFTGSLISSVYTNDSSNPFGATGLTFTYQLANTGSSATDA